MPCPSREGSPGSVGEVHLSKQRGWFVVHSMPPLFKMAAQNGADAAIRAHIGKGIPVDAIDERGRTALMLAAGRGHGRTCRLLLDVGATLEARDADGLDAVDHASRARKGDAAIVLLEHIRTVRGEGRPRQPAREVAAPVAADVDIDVSGWEAEPETVLPLADPQVRESTAAAQDVISSHKPIDLAGEWSAVPIRLPKRIVRRATPKEGIDVRPWRRLFSRALAFGEATSSAVRAAAEQQTDLDADLAFDVAVGVLDELGVHVGEFDPWLEGASGALPSSLSAGTTAAVQLFVARTPMHPERFRYLGLVHRRHAWHEHTNLAKQIEGGQKDVLLAIARDGRLFEALRNMGDDEDLSSGATTRPSPRMELVALLQTLRSPATQSPPGGLLTLAKARSAIHVLVAKVRSGKDRQGDGQLLVTAFDQWQDAWSRLVAGNLRLVIAFAKKTWRGTTDLEDVIQEGCIGLMVAADRFEYRRGVPFASYALWWIRARISRFVNTQLIVHRPSALAEAQRKITKAQRQLGSEDALATMATLQRLTGLPVETIRRANASTFDVVPLPSEDVDGQPEPAFADAFAAIDPPDTNLLRTEATSVLRQAIAALRVKPRDLEVLELCYGLSDVEGDLTLSEVGLRLGLSRERIRQIDLNLLGLLSGDPRLRELAPDPRTEPAE